MNKLDRVKYPIYRMLEYAQLELDCIPAMQNIREEATNIINPIKIRRLQKQLDRINETWLFYHSQFNRWDGIADKMGTRKEEL